MVMGIFIEIVNLDSKIIVFEVIKPNLQMRIIRIRLEEIMIN